MSILRVRDDKGNVQEILALRGEPGKDYVLTQKDKQEIADMIDGVEMNLNATPETIIDVISNAPEGAIVTLADGNYNMLTLTSKGQHGNVLIEGHPAATKFPKNLTITGTAKAIIEGISLTSGYKNSSNTFNVDTSFNTLSEGLSITNITITNTISLRNCNLDNLSIIGCTIGKGIYIAPNRFVDGYGIDGKTSNAATRYSLQRCNCKNILIKNNTILQENPYNEIGIYIQSCEDIVIRNNKITGGKQGIMIESLDSRTPTSKEVSIGENTITDSKTNCILIKGLVNADLHVVKNTLSNCGSTTRRFIVVQGYTNTFIRFERRSADGQNTYDGEKISTSDGIITQDKVSYLTDEELKAHTNDKTNPHKVTATQTGAPTLEEFNAHLADKYNPHGVTAKQIGIDTTNILWKNNTITVSPTDNLQKIIKDAQPNSIIRLEDGDYGFIMLEGKSSFPDNLTVYGVNEGGARIAGVNITSNEPAHEVVKSDPPNTRNSDINVATMHKNLKFKNVTFTKPFSLRNCDITGLKIEKCTFNDGATLELDPNGFGNYYGDDGSGTATFAPHYATRRVHDTVIKDCHFINGYALNETNGNELKHAIFARCVDGITIHNNIIDAANYNGIQISGNAWSATKPWYDAANKGRITITSNVINNTGSRSVRLNLFENAVITFIYNKMYNANLLPAEKTDNGEEAVKITKYDSNSRFVTTNYENEPNVKKTVQTNKYNDVTVTTGNTDKEYQIVSQQTSDFVKKNNWVTLTRGNCKECWGTITETIGHGMERIEFKLPFGVNDFVNWQITPKTGMFISYFDIMDIRADNDGNVELEINSSVANDYPSAELSLDIYCMTCDV